MNTFRNYELKNRQTALNIYHADEFRDYKLNFETIYKRKYPDWIENMIDDCRIEFIKKLDLNKTINKIKSIVESNLIDDFVDEIQSATITIRDREYWKIIMEKLQDEDNFERFKERYIGSPYSPPERLFK